MKLIAKKPCSFGGKKFYINEEIPLKLVADVALQERMGVLAVVTDAPGTSGARESLFTAEQVEEMISSAVAETRQKYEQKTFDNASDEVIAEADTSDVVIVPVMRNEDEDSAEMMAVPLTYAEVQKVFSIMQMVVPDAEKAIHEETKENILIVLHACDSRAGVKKAALKRADVLFSEKSETDEAGGHNKFTEDDTEAKPKPAS